jgi:hypothetical protein
VGEANSINASYAESKDADRGLSLALADEAEGHALLDYFMDNTS